MAVANVVAKFEADISDVQAKMAALKKSFSEAGDSSKALSERFKVVGTEMSRVGKGMTIGLTLPLAAVGAAAVKASVDFESSMSKIVGLVGIASDEVKQMQTEVLALSGETAKSPVELANGLFVVTSAGLRGSEAMEALEMSARAGAAGLGETNDIARAVAGALSAYGSDVLSAADATDQIVATARAGNFETSQFAAAIGRVLPFAQQAGASFADMGGAVALLTRVNGDAAQSVTQMSALFRAFVVPSEEAKKGLQDVGLSAQMLRDSIAKQGLPATLQMLDKALGGNREQLGRILGSSEAASAAFQILGADAQTLTDTFGVVADSAGMTDDAFAAAADTAGFKMQQAMVQLQAVLIEIGDIIVPLVTDFAKFAKTALEGFQSLPGPAKSVIVAFAGIVAALGPILWIGGKVVTAMGALSAAFLATRAKAIIAFRQIGASAKATQIQIQTSMIAARTSMGALVAGARAAGAGFVATMRTMTGAIRGFMAALGPVGIAIIGASVAYEAFVGAQQEAEDKVTRLTDAMKEQNAVMGEAVALQLAQDLQELAYGFAENTKFVDDLAALGISLDEVIMALMQGGDAMAALTDRVQAAAAGNDALRMAAGNVIGTLAMENDAVNQARAQYESYNAAKAIAAEVTGQAAAQTTGLTSATVSAAIAAGEAMGPTQGLTTNVSGLGAAAGEAATEIDIMRQEYNEWISVTGQIAAVDAAAASIDNLGKASVEFGTDLMGQTPKARDFRGEVIKAFEDSAQAAQSLSDDLPTQRAIFTGELIKIVNALKASGVKPKDIEAFLGAMDGLPASVSDIMRSAAKAVGDTNFKTEVEKAFSKSVKAGAPMTADAMERLAPGASNAAKEQLGLTLEPQLAGIIKSGTTALRPTAFNNGQLTGKSIGSGLANGIQASSPIVQAAVARVIAQAKAAADAAAESQSPSRLFARTGDDLVAGLVMGVTRSIPAGSREMSKAARMFMRAFMGEFMPRDMGAAETAIYNAIANAEQTLRDARDRLKEASRSVRDAEKALADARKNGDAKEVARAERDLAKARQEVNAATDAVKLGEWVRANDDALKALQKIAAQYDYIVGKMDGVREAFGSITELLATPLGTASDLSQMFGLDVDPRTMADNYMNLAEQIRAAYAVLTDPKIVGRKAASANRTMMDQTIGQLEQYVTQIMALQKEYEANVQAIASNEAKWREDEARLSAALADATRAYDEVLSRQKQIRDGFRSFVNDIGRLTDGMVAAVKTQTRELANGVRLIVQSADTTSAAGAIAANMKARLDEVKAFSANVKTLMERGLDPSLIRDFVEAGVSNSGKIVADLAAATDDELSAINATQAELLQHAGEFAEQYLPSGDFKAAVDAAKRDLEAARTAYEAERKRLADEQTRIEGEISVLVTQIEGLITGMMTTLVPATEAAAQASLDAMIAQFQKDFPRVSRELGRLMDALARSLQRTVTITVEADTSGVGGGRSVRSSFSPGSVVVQTPVSGRSVTVAPNAVSVNVTAGSGVDARALSTQVKMVVDESLQELAREIVAS